MGSLVGGFMMRALSPDPLTSLEVGTRYTFRYLGVAAFGTGLLYFFFDQLYIRRKKAAGIVKKDDDANNEQGLENPVYLPDDDQDGQVRKLNGKTTTAVPMEDGPQKV